MSRFKFASVRYCSLLKRNVVFESCYTETGEHSCECLNKSLCGYDSCGCRNRLYTVSRPACIPKATSERAARAE